MSQALLYVKAAEFRSADEKIVKLTTDDTQGAFDLVQQHLRSGSAVDVQTGDGQRAYYLLQGSVTFQRQEEGTFPARQGDIIFLPTGESSYELVSESQEGAWLLTITAPKQASGRPRLLPADHGRALGIMYDIALFKLTGAETAGAFLLVEWRVLPQRGVPMHAQGGQETFFVLEGSFAFRGQNETYEAEPGDVIHVPSRVRHSYKNIGTQPGKMLIAFFPAGKTLEYFQEIGIPLDDASAFPTALPDMARLLDSIQRHQVDVFASSPDDV